MKCISCGGEVGLTDKTCPFCGRVLNETAGYRRDLKKYRQESTKAKESLKKTITENVSMVISALVMILLIVALGIALYVEDNAYHFHEDKLRRESVKNYEEYSVQIRQYLDAGDYTGFVAIKEALNIAEFQEPYDDLCLLWEVAKEYSNMVLKVESAVVFGPEASRYDPEGNVRDCRMAIYDFYREYEYNLSEIEEDPYRDYIHDMKDKADILLRVYLGMDDAVREEYLAGSVNEQEAYLEGVILDE